MYMKFTQKSAESQGMIKIMKEYFNVAVMYIMLSFCVRN